MLLLCVRSQLQELEKLGLTLQAKWFQAVVLSRSGVWSFISKKFVHLLRVGNHVRSRLSRLSQFDQLATRICGRQPIASEQTKTRHDDRRHLHHHGHPILRKRKGQFLPNSIGVERLPGGRQPAVACTRRCLSFFPVLPHKSTAGNWVSCNLRSVYIWNSKPTKFMAKCPTSAIVSLHKSYFHQVILNLLWFHQKHTNPKT